MCNVRINVVSFVEWTRGGKTVGTMNSQSESSRSKSLFLFVLQYWEDKLDTLSGDHGQTMKVAGSNPDKMNEYRDSR